MKTDSVDQQGFADAILDYYYLLNKKYPEKGILKLIGDRYKLTGPLRTVLHRGIWTEKDNKTRNGRLIQKITNKDIVIDGYNVIFTLLNYKMGRLVFLSTDNFCRDAGSLFGKIKKQEIFRQTLFQLFQLLLILKPAYIHLFFDIPVSFSIEHKLYAEKLLAENNLMGTVYLAQSADNEIKTFSNEVLCTSDSHIIDTTKNEIADLARMAIEYFYKPDMLNLRLMLDAML